MGLFGKKYSGNEGSSNALNAFLGSGTEYRGRLEFMGTVRIDGTFHGEISAEGSLVLGKDAKITGQVQVGTLISNGQIEGDVTVRNKAILQKHSMLEGSLKTQALVVEEGATIEGTVEMSSRRSGENVALPSETAALNQAEDQAEDTGDDQTGEQDEDAPLPEEEASTATVSRVS